MQRVHPIADRGPGGPPEVTLSLDNGPEPEVTPRVLDLPARHGIGARPADPARRALAARAQVEGFRGVPAPSLQQSGIAAQAEGPAPCSAA